MQIFLVLALVIAILAVVFAVQNVAVVAISFFTWKVDLSLAVALLLALAAGVLITLLLSVPGRVKGTLSSAALKKKLTALEAERIVLKQKIDELTVERATSTREISNLEEELANLSALLNDQESRLGVRSNLPASGSGNKVGENQPQTVVESSTES